METKKDGERQPKKKKEKEKENKNENKGVRMLNHVELEKGENFICEWLRGGFLTTKAKMAPRSHHT